MLGRLRRRGVQIGIGLLLLGLCVSGIPATAAGGGPPAPYRLALQIGWGEPAGSERFRETLEQELQRELDREGCFETVLIRRPGDDGEYPATDLVFALTLEEYEERLEHELSIAQRTSPNSIPQEDATRRFAQIEVTVVTALYVDGIERPILARRFHEAEGYRPRLFEDPMVEAKWRLIDHVTREARKIVCGKSPRKLERAIAEATAGD